MGVSSKLSHTYVTKLADLVGVEQTGIHLGMFPSLHLTTIDAYLASAAHLQIPHELLDRPGDEVGRGAGDGTIDHHDSSLDEHASVGDLPRGEARV